MVENRCYDADCEDEKCHNPQHYNYICFDPDCEEVHCTDSNHYDKQLLRDYQENSDLSIYDHREEIDYDEDVDINLCSCPDCADDHDHDHEDADHDHEDADHEDADHDHDHDEHEKEYDEHVWLSLKNTMFLCDTIAEALKKVDPSHADLYQANVDAYKKELSALDAEYAAVVGSARVKTLLFGDRFPFRYLTDDYGLKYYAAFVGCSAETEASFETVIFLAEKTDELGLPVILTIEGTEHKLAETIKNNTKTKDQKLLSLNSMQSTNSKDIEAGASYISIMKENLEVLKEALK